MKTTAARDVRQNKTRSSAPRERTSASPLLSPEALIQKYPLAEELLEEISDHRRRLSARVLGESTKPLVIVGPCSVHCEEAVLEYAEKLARVREGVQDELEIVMRVYFEKPRTTVGWKGFLYDPDLDGSEDLGRGLEASRRLMRAVVEKGLPVATELLDPLVAPYIEDCVSWAAVGARTSESQIHRQMVSGLSFPVGFKNSTHGCVKVAGQAMAAAREPHSHLGVNEYGALCQMRTPGNAMTHAVLRGGSQGPNFCELSVSRAAAELQAQGQRPALLIDCSHANSEKDFRRQPEVARSVIAQLKRRDVDVLGLMLESHLRAGKQSLGGELEYGVSITDGCIDFETTESLLLEIAESVARS